MINASARHDTMIFHFCCCCFIVVAVLLSLFFVLDTKVDEGYASSMALMLSHS